MQRCRGTRWRPGGAELAALSLLVAVTWVVERLPATRPVNPHEETRPSSEPTADEPAPLLARLRGSGRLGIAHEGMSETPPREACAVDPRAIPEEPAVEPPRLESRV